MTTTIPPVQAAAVRPLWERHKLFREPQYTDGSEWNPDDGIDSNDTDQPED